MLFCVWLLLLSTASLRFTHVSHGSEFLSFLRPNDIALYVYYPLICEGTFGLFPPLPHSFPMSSSEPKYYKLFCHYPADGHFHYSQVIISTNKAAKRFFVPPYLGSLEVELLRYRQGVCVSHFKFQ